MKKYLFIFILFISVSAFSELPRTNQQMGGDDPSIVGIWNFNQRSGTIGYDVSNESNHGAFVSAPVWVDGYLGSCLDFDGIDDWINCGLDDSLRIAEQITIITWIYPEGLPVSLSDIVGKQTYYFAFNSDGKIQAAFAGTDNVGWHIGDTVLPLNKWARVGITWNGAKIRLFVNGEVDFTDNMTGLINDAPTSKFAIGRSWDVDNTSCFNGKIDGTILANRGFSDAEMKNDYQSQSLARQ